MEIPRSERRAAPRSLLIAAAAITALTAVAILAIDRPLARLIDRFEPSPIWNNAIGYLEYLVGWPLHPLAAPVALVVGMLVTLAVPRLRGHAPLWMFLAGTHLVARFATSHLKDLTGRLRPVAWNFLPTRGDSFFEGGAAFPSGHVTLFASLALPLALYVPRARIPLGLLVAFVAAARIAVNAHWLSDTLASFALVSLVAYLLALALRPLPRAS